MSHIEQKEPISLWLAWLIYFAAWFCGYLALAAFFVLSDGYSWHNGEGVMPMFVANSVINIIIGIVLVRYYLPRLGIDWHPMYNPVGGIARAKLGYVFFWWAAWPITFIKIFIAEYL